MRRSDAAAPVGTELEHGRLGVTFERTRIGNPFARFRTRSYWLGAIIRRSRAAETSRAKPDWFNR